MTDEARMILERLPELLRQTPQLRYQIYDLLAERFVEKAEFNRLLAEIQASRQEADRRFDALERRFEAVDRRFEAMQAESNRRFEAVLLEIKGVKDSISALGQRWGIQTEEAVRAFAERFLATEFGVQAERWRGPEAELDLIVQNGRCCLLEVTSYLDADKLQRFLRNVQVFSETTGKMPTRRIIITAHATGTAWELAAREGVEIVSG